MADVIKIEISAEDIASIYHEWTGGSLTKKQAQSVLKKIKEEVEEKLDRSAFSIISTLVERY